MKVAEPAHAHDSRRHSAVLATDSSTSVAGAGAATPSLRLTSVCKQYGGFEAVREVSLDVRKGEFVTLLGPSGSGKTTTLMMIAGFIDPTRGRIDVDGRDVTDDPPQRRNIGMVFQNYALFPHLTVFRNVAFPLEVRNFASRDIRAKAMEALDIVKLRDLADRYPSQLSGGQQQRVALARAIVFGPPLLLMDEPLGALDKKLREHMQIELLKIKERLGVTVIYVTHDQEEALVMSDRVVIMANGTIQQVGRPDELYRRPANRFVADFVGETNLIEGRVVTPGTSPTIALLSGTHVRSAASRSWTQGERGFVAFRPECVRVGAPAETCANRMQAVVERVIYAGDVSRVLLNVAGNQTLSAKLQNSGEARSMEAGAEVTIGWEPDATWLVPDVAA